MQVGAVEVIVLRAVAALVSLPERNLLDEVAALVEAEMLRRGRDRGPAERGLEPERVQHARGVGADLDSGADLAERRRLLEHAHPMAALQQHGRGA